MKICDTCHKPVPEADSKCVSVTCGSCTDIRVRRMFGNPEAPGPRVVRKPNPIPFHIRRDRKAKTILRARPKSSTVDPKGTTVSGQSE